MRDAPAPLDVPLQWTWRLAIVLLPLGAGIVAVLCGLELAGIVARDSLLRGAGDAERWAGVAVGALAQPFAWTALRHGRLRLDADSLRWLGFGFVGTTRRLPLVEVRRWGAAVATNRGRRERQLLFERHDGTLTTIKLAMYAGQQQVLAALTERLGAAAPASATITGLRFDEPV